MEDLVSIFDLAREKRVPIDVIEELIDAKFLYATPGGWWIHRSSVEALDRFLEAVRDLRASQSA